MSREVFFRVKGYVNAGESLYVTGDRDELGNWKPSTIFPLEKTIDSEHGEIWTGSIHLPSDATVKYRYVIATQQIHGDKTLRIIRRWETALQPREWSAIRNNGDDKLHHFGCYDGETRIDKGWLTAGAVVQIRVLNNPLQIWDQRYGKQAKFSLKITAVDLCNESLKSLSGNECSDVHSIHSSPDIEIACMNSKECRFVKQNLYGRGYNPDDYVVFQTMVISPEQVAYKVDVFFTDPCSKLELAPEHVGCGYIMPSTFEDTAGVASVSIIGTNLHPVGELKVHCLIIRPIHGYECDLSVSYAKYFSKSGTCLDIGHRGAGNSFHHDPQHCADIRENTIASMELAGRHGADYVEFDVQLSKDLVPVVYHDFFVCMCVQTSPEGTPLLYKVPVQDLNFDQMRKFKLYHVKEKLPDGGLMAKNFVNDGHPGYHAFATLSEFLHNIDKHLGFNIEIKRGTQLIVPLQDHTHEVPQQMDMNIYLDVLIKTVLEEANGRRIVFSCFHPDVCTMIRWKQNKYPVVFLTQGISEKYQPYLDPRMRSISAAIDYAHSADILGINVHTEDLLKDPSNVKLCQDAGFVVFCWGDDNISPQVREKLKAFELDGIIYDRMDQNNIKP